MSISAMDLIVSTSKLLLLSVTVWFLLSTEWRYLSCSRLWRLRGRPHRPPRAFLNILDSTGLVLGSWGISVLLIKCLIPENCLILDIQFLILLHSFCSMTPFKILWQKVQQDTRQLKYVLKRELFLDLPQLCYAMHNSHHSQISCHKWSPTVFIDKQFSYQTHTSCLLSYSSSQSSLSLVTTLRKTWYYNLIGQILREDFDIQMNYQPLTNKYWLFSIWLNLIFSSICLLFHVFSPPLKYITSEII